jgi:hypothetical protein
MLEARTHESAAAAARLRGRDLFGERRRRPTAAIALAFAPALANLI